MVVGVVVVVGMGGVGWGGWVAVTFFFPLVYGVSWCLLAGYNTGCVHAERLALVKSMEKSIAQGVEFLK